MSWKKFKEEFSKGLREEHYFILGLDIGNATSSIAYFDLNQNTPEIIDISGGYGKPSVPTMMQYINDTDEWIFGEYAMTARSSDKDKFLSALVEKLGTGEYIEIAGKPMSVSSIIRIYIKELMENCRNINPKAEIAGIAVSVPSYLTREAKAELYQAFKLAGYERQLIGFYDDRECILNKYYYEKDVKDEKIFIIDFGAREIRGGVYETQSSQPGKNNEINIDCRAFLFDEKLGTNKIDSKVTDMFTEIYCSNYGLKANRISEQENEQIRIFAYQHKDMLFQKNPEFKPVKLYFNFGYPPFQHTIEYGKIENIVGPIEKMFIEFIKDVLSKPTLSSGKLTLSDIDNVICTGGGFEMLWARTAVKRAFQRKDVVFYRNPKGMAAEGASIIAARELAVIPNEKTIINDKNKLEYDLGFKILKDNKERFLPVVECNSFWWQNHLPKRFVLMEATDETVYIEILKRKKDGSIDILRNIALEGLPKRPKGATKLFISFGFLSIDRLLAKVKDIGFGELFPPSGYEEEFVIGL